jgi:hypothetical protein
MQFLDAENKPIATTPSDKLTFADGDLIGYDYWQDRKSLKSVKPLRARFDLKLPDRAVSMTAWLQGMPGREYFSVMAPPSTAWEAGTLPRESERAPLPTLVIRQPGEAWARPFTAVFEANAGTPPQVLNVEQFNEGPALALRVTTLGERKQTIVSGDSDDAGFRRDGIGLKGRYAVVSEQKGQLDYLFLGSGREASGLGYALSADSAGSAAAIWRTGGRWLYSASSPMRLCVPAGDWPGQLEFTLGDKKQRIVGRTRTLDGKRVLEFDMPAMVATTIR